MKLWEGAEITHTMADSRVDNWERILRPMQCEVHRVLEIGSYEGQSALFWHHFFGAHVTCIDTWKNFYAGAASAEEVEAHFNSNTWEIPHTKIKQRSTEALVWLSSDSRLFDLVYVDGDHSRLQVMIDSCLAWRLLRSGGIMIWDDYQEYEPDLVDRPTPAIDAFCAMMGNELAVMENTGQQLIVRKV